MIKNKSLPKQHLILLIINLALIIGFGARFALRLNYEFLIYVGVIIGFLGLIAASIRKVDYTPATLTGLTVWSALHLAGGGVPIAGGRLYDVILIPLSSAWPIFRYDQLVHIWGFGASTLLMWSLLQGSLADPRRYPLALGIVLVMAGLGAGALNEIVEFLVASAVPESGVGGYLNTALDLCADLIGALLALVYIRLRYIAPGERDA
ncbi:DUF2238 domain-containing protein [Candidatus Sumerlaeota bacterium]|nr:DUF2238 domain-containing protein [Candidatus Sumerlaeota bacterium]